MWSPRAAIETAQLSFNSTDSPNLQTYYNNARHFALKAWRKAEMPISRYLMTL
jgi:hypothetical protein